MITKNARKHNKKNCQNTQKEAKIILLNELINENEKKDKKSCSEFTINQVKAIVEKKFLRISRMCKLYWAINAKNRKYRSFMEQYSTKDILAMTNSLLKRDKEKTVCNRTIQKDIKLMNKIGLLKTETIRFGAGRGSLSFYVQNKDLTDKYKDIIQNEVITLLKEELKGKIIIGDLDKQIAKVKFNKEQTLRLIKELEKEKEKKRKYQVINKSKSSKPNSHDKNTHLFKLDNNYIHKKNSKEIPLDKVEKKRKTKIRNGVEERLINKQKISKKYVQIIKKNSNNDTTYTNALLNLETALCDYTKEYNKEDITRHFTDEFLKKYKNKIWMMMRRKDGVTNDYQIIWESKFKKKYPKKQKENTLFNNNRRKTNKERDKSYKENVTKTKKELKDNIFSILLAQTTKTKKEINRKKIGKITKKFINSIENKLSYKDILNNKYYYSLLEIIEKENIYDNCKSKTRKMNRKEQHEYKEKLMINTNKKNIDEKLSKNKNVKVNNLKILIKNNYLEKKITECNHL
ncbi:hypothetical protein F0310_04650 (plasmid) [Borrelia sp. A-FGy1]|uniref:plasmid maintenance protein n=1 Tax=Borrelia sp. A-FGy1 TaxID=2608247 RepID=UPI0015F71346|nr:plasmid maintenance protein [Borrelia sp. A-FGy1]QMU99707.1 hypothetical protein F0310_04650 [Borrelia sp. A-FGy1]